MGAKHVINPNQLTMFERAGDLADHKKFYPMDSLPDEYENLGDEYEDAELNTPESKAASMHAYHAEAREMTAETKLNETMWNYDLYGDVAEHGIKKPILVGQSPKEAKLKERTGGEPSRGVVNDGHHRVYAQAHANNLAKEDGRPEREWVPVTWDN